MTVCVGCGGGSGSGGGRLELPVTAQILAYSNIVWEAILWANKTFLYYVCEDQNVCNHGYLCNASAIVISIFGGFFPERKP
jgi:hypothetical protein